MNKQLEYCRTLARAHAYGEYLAVLKAEPKARAALLTLLALEAELSHIALRVKEELLAHMRYAWWREGVEALTSGQPPRAQPVMAMLGYVLNETALPPQLLFTMIDAHQQSWPAQLPGVSSAFRETAEAIGGASYNKARALVTAHEAKRGEGGRFWLTLKLLLKH
jgi:Squalene/phytoene synthase